MSVPKKCSGSFYRKRKAHQTTEDVKQASALKKFLTVTINSHHTEPSTSTAEEICFEQDLRDADAERTPRIADTQSPVPTEVTFHCW